MKKEFVCLAARALACAALLQSTFAAAQTPSQPKLFALHREAVRPSMVATYEATDKEFLQLLRQAPGKLGKLGFTTFMADDFSYYTVAPIASYEDIPAIYAGFGETAAAVGPAKLGDVMQRNGAAIEFISDSVLSEDPSLSYTPAKPRLKPEEIGFAHFDVYYVQPGHDMEAQEIARDIRKLFEKKGIADGYRLFTVLTGGEMPAIVVSIEAKDEADYAASSAANRQKLGSEGAALFARAFANTRRFETVNATIRPDLSFRPAQ